MDQKRAETIALLALEWIVGNDEIRGVFLGSTGMSLQELSTVAEDPDVLVSILDFVAMDDAWVLEFCEKIDLEPAEYLSARQQLPGGDSHHWT